MKQQECLMSVYLLMKYVCEILELWRELPDTSDGEPAPERDQWRSKTHKGLPPGKVNLKKPDILTVLKPNRQHNHNIQTEATGKQLLMASTTVDWVLLVATDKIEMRHTDQRIMTLTFANTDS